jgi:hypothetical protein
MPAPKDSLTTPDWLILIGCTLFILVLALSAFWEADIRWLHFFQAWMYIAAIALGLRRNRWGFFIGMSAAGLWDYTNLFVTSFLASGVRELSAWFQTGHLQRPDQAIAVAAWLSNLSVLIGCAWAYSRLAKKPALDIAVFSLTFVLTTGYFALIMFLLQPRYLALFPRMLHPHMPG